MIVDSSAMIAILYREPEQFIFDSAITEDAAPKMSAVSYLETALRLDGLEGGCDPELDALIERLNIAIVPFTGEQAREARLAAVRYGKPQHPAALNFGDCMTYALVKASGEPLLCKGKDFPQTDLQLVFLPERPAS